MSPDRDGPEELPPPHTTLRTSVLDPYRRILAIPGALAFSLAGLVARMPISMLGLAIVLLVSDHTGSYALAGGVSAAAVLAGAVGSPLQGRITDRYGQARLLLVASVTFGFAVVLLVTSVRQAWPLPLPHVCAALAGVSLPQAGSMVRARWTHVVRDRQMLQTAFALEAVVDEVVFVVGPVVATFLATLWDPYAGLLAAAFFGVVGGLALSAQRATEPRVDRDHHRDARRAPLDWRALAPLVLSALGFGMLFGTSEVVAVAFTTEQGVRNLAGVLLAVWAVGSLVAGVVVGARPPQVSTVVQFRIAVTLLTLSWVPLLFTSSVVVAMVFLLFSGLAISPSLVAMMTLVERTVPRERLTEGIGWTTTGMAAGVAPGAALSGWVVDHVGASAGFGVGLASAGLAAAVAWTMRDRRG